MKRSNKPLLAVVAAGALALFAAGLVSGNPKGETQMETGTQASEMLGKSFEDAKQELGEPFKENQFELGTEVLEYRIELTNYFDSTRRAENPPQIREAAWSLSDEENLTLWFTQGDGATDWRVLHYLAWHPDDQF